MRASSLPLLDLNQLNFVDIDLSEPAPYLAGAPPF
jgi:hypothetical protein